MNNNQYEQIFLKYSLNYLRAVQERIASFFIAINYQNIQQKVDESSELWKNLVINEVESFYKLLYHSNFKQNDKNFMKRKGYRDNNTFAFDLITNWVFERSILPYIHKYSGLEGCSPFYLNPDTCDTDAKLGWDLNNKRKINSNYDFLTEINNEIHKIELKSMFVYNKRSANFKIFCTPKNTDELNKHHILFLHFNGIGNPKILSPDKTIFKIFYIPWEQLIKAHIHYPPHLDRKPCYLVHFKGDESCEQYNINGVKESFTIGHNKNCFVFDKIILEKIIRYEEISKYLNYNDKKFDPNNILNIIKQY